ncbi:MAG TPA: hypothetical protein VJN18_11495 [Polyangiaceae bacterium]|nr:hypothetical protein [Polyangiaceae bacterium]
MRRAVVIGHTGVTDEQGDDDFTVRKLLGLPNQRVAVAQSEGQLPCPNLVPAARVDGLRPDPEEA